MFKFDNSFYNEFSADFYQEIMPKNFPHAQLIYFNDDLAKVLGIAKKQLSSVEKAAILSGQKIHPCAKPIALAYGGHQFGNFVPQLGDGRAILLGEIINQNNQRFDLQLKGSGPTKFSRRGDGFLTLKAAIRELIIGEALHNLQIPTSRILSLVITNEAVYRESVNMGAVIARVADSHIRVGTFEYWAFKGDQKSLHNLCNYVAKRHFPQENSSAISIKTLFYDIVLAQANLIAKLQANGFIHGVMNSDNMAIGGQALDFGPCAFLDEYDENKVFSAIDYNGRYAYKNQSAIAKWNLWILANCLHLIYANAEELLEILNLFSEKFEEKYYKIMSQKLGFEHQIPKKLIADLLQIMQHQKSDYHQTFFKLSDDLLFKKNQAIKGEEYKNWLLKWRDLLANEYDFKNNNIVKKIAVKMRQHNPYLIARNHIVQQVIEAGDNLDFQPLKNYLRALKKPFICDEKYLSYHNPPKANQKILQTFCGT